jgi:uracil-DNA glycosylase family 4
MQRGRGYVPGKGPVNPKFAIVGQSVGRHEIENNEPFSGPAGSILNEILKSCGIRREECYITNVLKYQPAKIPKLNAWEDFGSVELLWEELEKVNPEKIIALGSVPLYFLTGKSGINEYRGSIFRTQRLSKLCVGTYNPAHLLYQESGSEIAKYWQKYIIAFDIQKLAKISLDWNPPHRNLIIAKSSADVYRFAERLGKIVSCDIETMFSVPGCIAFASNIHEAMSIPLFPRIGDIQITTIPLKDIVEIWRLIQKIFDEKEIEGQNFKFDQERLEKELLFKIPHFRSDTMLKAHVLNPELPKSQAFLTSIYTDEPYYKDEGRDFNPKRDNISQWLLYNAKDAAVNREISDRQDEELREEGLYDYYYDYYHHLHHLYYEIESIGLVVDEDRRKELIAKYEEKLKKNEEIFKEFLGFVPNPNSPKDVALVVYESLGLPKRESLDEDTLVALMANHCSKDPIKKRVLQAIIDGRRLKKILGPDRLRFKTDFDGKARTSYRIAGTETGRSSTALLGPPLRVSKCGLSFQTMSKHGDVGSDFRSMFVPPPGMIFINVDQSQAEARIVALLSEDYDLLELFDCIDIHKLTFAIGQELPIIRKASNARKAIELRDEVNESLKLITKDERFVGKGLRHAGNYDMGKRKYMLKLNTDARRFGIPISISEWRAGQQLDRFHAFSPKIRMVFHTQIRECIENNRLLIRPDGSKRFFHERIGPDLYREAYADIPQHTVAHQTKRAMLLLKKEIPDLQIVLEAHDAFLIQCPEKDADVVAELAKKFMSLPIDFSECSLKRSKIVIPADVEFGYNYAEMKPWRHS